MVDIATSVMVSMLNNSQMGLGGGQVATSTPLHYPHLLPPHSDLWDVLPIIFCPASPFQIWQAERMRAKSGILPTSVQELWCSKLWQGCFYRKLSDSVGSKKVCDKSSDMLCKIYCGWWGEKQKLSGRWAVNNNSAQQQERYAEVEYVFLQHGVIRFFSCFDGAA